MAYYKKIELENGNILMIRQCVDGQMYDPRDPDNFPNLGIITAWHPRYDLHDEGWKMDRYKSNPPEAIKKYLSKEHDAAVILPLYLHDHSGLALSTESFEGRVTYAQLDSGLVGFIFAKLSSILKAWNKRKLREKLRGKVITELKGEVQRYHHYLNGKVYSYEVQNSKGEYLQGCSGFYGDNFSSNGIGTWLNLNEAELECLEASEWKFPKTVEVYD